jgi:hypothetical protein
MNLPPARDNGGRAGVLDVMMKLRAHGPLSCLLALAIAGLPLGAFAQAGGDVTITGSIATIDAAGNMDLNDDQGYSDTVHLDQHTVIRPAGTQLVAGMAVTVVGLNRGSFLAAERVDVAADSVSSAPVPPVAPVPPDAPVPPVAMAPLPQAPPSYAGQAPGQPPPPPAPELPPRLAAAGNLTGTLDTPLDSRHSAVGDNVVLTDVVSADGSIRRATLSGTVTAVTRAGQGHNAQIDITFDLLQLRDGTAYHVTGVVQSMQVTTKSNALKELGGALAGMLIGNAVVKTALGVSGGGIAGAVGGYFIAKDNRADVVIPDHSAISVRLLDARRQAS